MLKKHLFFIIFIGLIYTNVHSQTTESSISDIKLDHFIIAVSDLDKATKTYSDLGFTIKKGRLHSNGLINNHLKFRDGSSVELMTVQGEAKDKLARIYQEFLDNQEGGIYVAISAPFDLVMEKADELGLSYQPSFGDPFSYITLENEGLQNVFFINYKKSFTDPDSILTHNNNVTGINGVWIEASPVLIELISLLGAKFKGIMKTPDGKQNPVYRLNNFDLIIDSSISKDAKIKGVLFDSLDLAPLEWSPPSSNHGIWITFR